MSLRADELPDPGATSLAILGGRAAGRQELIVALLDGLERRIAGLRAEHEIVGRYSLLYTWAGSDPRRSRSHSSRIRMSFRWRRAPRRIGSSRPLTA